MTQKYFIDDNCIGCGNCIEVAPFNIVNDGDTFRDDYRINKQPTTEEEIENMKQAMDKCPVDAILYNSC